MAAGGKNGEKHDGGRDDSGKLVIVMNASLVGVPAAYAVSDSVSVTVITAVLTVSTAAVYLLRRRP